MSFSAIINGKEFQTLVSCAASVSEKSVIPILECARLRVSGGKLYVAATNTTQGVEASAPCAGMGGVAVVPLPVLGPITKALWRASDVTLTLDGNDLIVKQSGRQYKLPTLDPIDFPDPIAGHDKPTQSSWRCDGGTLANAIKATGFAAEDEGLSRYYLQGVHFDPVNRALVSTDGHKLSAEVAQWCDSGNGVTIPAGALHAISALTGEVTIEIRDGSAFFRAGAVLLKTKLVAADFPDWRRLVLAADELSHRASVKREAFSEAVTAAGMADIASKNGSGISINFAGGNGVIDLRGSGSDKPSAKIEFEYEPIAGGDFGICLNHRYLSETLRSLAGETDVVIGKAPESKSAGIFIRGVTNPERVRVVMAMRG